MEFDSQYFAAREEGIRWLRRDYDRRQWSVGLSILERMRFKPLLFHRLQMRGETPITKRVLVAAVRDGANVYRNPGNPKYADGIPADLEVETAGVTTVENTEEPSVENQDNVPLPVRKLLRWFAQAYKRRAVVHRELRSIGERNDATSMARRSGLSSVITALSDYMDALYPLRAAWEEHQIVPTDSQLSEIGSFDTVWQRMNAAPKEEAPKPEPKTVSKKEDFGSMKREELLVRKHSIRSMIKRKENQLLYQSNSSKDKENPMPFSPARTKLEVQVRILKDKLYEVDKALAQFG